MREKGGRQADRQMDRHRGGEGGGGRDNALAKQEHLFCVFVVAKTIGLGRTDVCVNSVVPSAAKPFFVFYGPGLGDDCDTTKNIFFLLASPSVLFFGNRFLERMQ